MEQKRKDVVRSGIYEGLPIAFHRKLTSQKKGIAEIVSRSRHATHAALPMVGFDYEKHPPDIFLRSG